MFKKSPVRWWWKIVDFCIPKRSHWLRWLHDNLSCSWIFKEQRMECVSRGLSDGNFQQRSENTKPNKTMKTPWDKRREDRHCCSQPTWCSQLLAVGCHLTTPSQEEVAVCTCLISCSFSWERITKSPIDFYFSLENWLGSEQLRGLEQGCQLAPFPYPTPRRAPYSVEECCTVCICSASIRVRVRASCGSKDSSPASCNCGDVWALDPELHSCTLHEQGEFTLPSRC